MRWVLSLVLMLSGAAAGLGAAFMLRPAPDGADVEGAAGPESEGRSPAATTRPDARLRGAPAGLRTEYVRLNNQFVVPVVKGERVHALVVLSISLETTAGTKPQVFEREPRLRDAMLQILFDHANAGGFERDYTRADRMHVLRQALFEQAAQVLGGIVHDVLITDIVRQDA